MLFVPLKSWVNNKVAGDREELLKVVDIWAHDMNVCHKRRWENFAEAFLINMKKMRKRLSKHIFFRVYERMSADCSSSNAIIIYHAKAPIILDNNVPGLND